MTFRKRFLVGSVSLAALAAAAPALAATDTASDTSSANTVGEVVVTGIKESLQRAIVIKKANEDQVEAVSAVDVGKLPDKNIADVLQRVPGLNTESAASGEGGFDENDRVSIRGTSPSLTQVTVDGHAVATGDWFILDQFSTVGRSVSFTLLPAELIGSTVVYKSQDAALLEGGVAGVVDLITPNAIDLGKGKPFLFEGLVEGAYNSLTGQWKPQLNGTLAWANQDATFGVSVQGFYEDRTVRRYGQETLGYESITSAMPIGAANPSLIGVQAPTLIGSTLFEQERTREGGHFDVAWRPDPKVELSLDGYFAWLKAANVNDNYMYWGSNELGNNLPTSFKVANNTLIAASWPTIAPNSPFVAAAQRGNPVDGIIVDNIFRPGSRAYTSYINLDGKFQVTDALTVKAKVGYTQGQGATDSSPFFEADAATGVNYMPSGNGWQVTPTAINPSSPAGLNNDFAINETFDALDKEIYGQVDADYALNMSVLKDVAFGIRGAQHSRVVEGWDRGCTLGAHGACTADGDTGLFPFAKTDPTPYPGGFNAGALGIPGLLIPIAGNTGAIQQIIDAIPGGVRGPISAIKQPLNFYWPGAFKVQENDIAGYVMAHLEGDNWRGNLGVRVVETQENAFTNVSDPSGANPADIKSSAFGPFFVNHVQHNYLDPLPSLNFTYDLQKNLLFRFSAAETISRPDYSALGGTVTLNDLTLTGNGGNADLKPIKAAVVDGALEWYYGPTAVAAVSLFYDDLQSYVTFGTHTATFQNQFLSKNGPVFTPYVISSPTNIAGHVEGIELQDQQPLPWNFGFQANFTYINGSDAQGNPLVGTSNVTYNVVGYYEVKQFNVRLAYTYRSHYFVGLDRSAQENQAGFGQLDASLNINITPNVTFTVDGLNLTNTLLKYYAANPTQVRAVYDNGTQVYAGVHVKF
ncbi:MAG TPA: TonB-dependent receptor [Caulobacteraceae bacterium]|jgi:iron complex outermembrane receptor protein